MFYILKPETNLKTIKIFPKLYQKEVDELVRQINEQGIPISKERSTGFSFGNINLNVEFVWAFLPIVLAKRSSERVRLIVTNQVLRQAVTAFLLVKELDINFDADLIVSPFIIHPGKKEKWNLDRLKTLGFDGNLLRFILLSSLGWDRKETNLYDSLSKVEYRRFNLLCQAIKFAVKEKYDIQEMMKNISQQNLLKGLSNVFNPERFNYQTLNGLF